MVPSKLIHRMNWKIAILAQNRPVLLAEQERPSFLTDIAKREMIVVVVVVGVKEGKTMVVRGEEIWVVEAAVAGGAEGDVVGGAEK